jgi:uncharacterized membrane protein (UPF0127 family)
MKLVKYSKYKLKKICSFLITGAGILVSVLAVALIVVYTKILPCVPTQKIEVSGTKIWICVANTSYEQQRGLSYSKWLPKKWGMLFAFEEYSRHSFWMKDMNYPIDILWLDEKLQPVEMAAGADPDSYPGIFTPTYVNKFVLETRPGVITTNVPKVNYSP